MSAPRRMLDGESIALVGAQSPIGQRIREALERRHVDGGRVHMFAADSSETAGEAQLSEYAGEPRLIQEPDPDAIACHPYVFLCGPGDATRRLASQPPPGRWVLDLCHDRSGDRNVRYGGLPGEDPGAPGLLAMPHPLSTAITTLLEPLGDALAGLRWSGWCMRPAADFGQAGVDELREQTVRLLNFTSSPKDVFGHQLAFNVLPEPVVPEAGASVRARVRGDLSRRFPGVEGDLQLSVAPVFFGHVLSLHLRFTSAEAAAAGIAALDLPAEPPPQASPVELGIEDGARAAWFTPSGSAAGWLWAVFGNLDAEVAARVLEDVESLPKPAAGLGELP